MNTEGLEMLVEYLFWMCSCSAGVCVFESNCLVVPSVAKFLHGDVGVNRVVVVVGHKQAVTVGP